MVGERRRHVRLFSAFVGADQWSHAVNGLTARRGGEDRRGHADSDSDIAPLTAAPLIAGVELGGTKCVCILARGPDDIVAERRVATTDPATTLAAIEATLDGWRAHAFAALGIASFGPVSLDRNAADYGHITATPKPGWRDADVAGRLERRFGVPTGFHTDVTGAALGEGRWGAARGLADYAYVTVGTGVGVGMIARGVPVDGMTHAELGHIRPVRMPGDDWPGICSFHGACVEGLVSGPAIAARAGRPERQPRSKDLGTRRHSFRGATTGRAAGEPRRT